MYAPSAVGADHHPRVSAPPAVNPQAAGISLPDHAKTPISSVPAQLPPSMPDHGSLPAAVSANPAVPGLMNMLGNGVPGAAFDGNLVLQSTENMLL